MPKSTAKVTRAMRKATEQRLRRIARVGEVFIDGDAFKDVVLERDIASGDGYRVDHEKFIQVKRSLFKLKRIEPGDLAVMTWRKYKDLAALTVIVDFDPARRSYPGRFPITPAMAAAFEGRTAAQGLDVSGVPMLSVFAPIRDSLNEVVGVLELFASLRPDKLEANLINY